MIKSTNRDISQALPNSTAFLTTDSITFDPDKDKITPPPAALTFTIEPQTTLPLVAQNQLPSKPHITNHSLLEMPFLLSTVGTGLGALMFLVAHYAKPKIDRELDICLKDFSDADRANIMNFLTDSAITEQNKHFHMTDIMVKCNLHGGKAVKIIDLYLAKTNLRACSIIAKFLLASGALASGVTGYLYHKELK